MGDCPLARIFNMSLKHTRFRLALMLMGPPLLAQDFTPNYEESAVPEYSLPDPLRMEDGREVLNAEQWRLQRRPELLGLFEEHVYGALPAPSPSVEARVLNTTEVFEGRAVRRQVALEVQGKTDGPIHLLIYSPSGVEAPPPAFLGLNFKGNHTVHSDDGILLAHLWTRLDSQLGWHHVEAGEVSRGSRQSRWPVERILDRGYALVTAYYGDIDGDFDDGFKNGVHGAFLACEPGALERTPASWGAISAWAWGLSRALDYLQSDPLVDGTRVALLGHSRLGKTALWAGAQDERFAMVISNNSGCGGAALSRRQFGETVKRINDSFPHWFCQRFRVYNENEDALPVDQHQLIALIAPRPTLICSAEEDRWADPKGEVLAAHAAAPVFRLLDSAPLLHHLRPGKHDVTAEDWTTFLDFADREL